MIGIFTLLFMYLSLKRNFYLVAPLYVIACIAFQSSVVSGRYPNISLKILIPCFSELRFRFSAFCLRPYAIIVTAALSSSQESQASLLYIFLNLLRAVSSAFCKARSGVIMKCLRISGDPDIPVYGGDWGRHHLREEWPIFNGPRLHEGGEGEERS